MSADPFGGRPLVTVAEAAAWLGWGRSATYEAIRRGEIPCLRRGRCMFVPAFRLLPLLGLTPAEVAGADVTNP